MQTLKTSLVAQMVKASAYIAGDPGSIPGLGRSPGEGIGNPLQYGWEIPWTEEPGRLQSRVARIRHDLATKPPLPFYIQIISVMPKYLNILSKYYTYYIKY